jgi:NADP-dependent 3-hydroxy acid dehydrogenase YdfG
MKVIVTGASRGIGRGIATYLAKEGFELGLLARSEEDLRELQQEILAHGGQCYIHACNLRDERNTEFAIATLIEFLRGVDALINNAGVVIRKSIFDITPDEFRELVETNLNGLFYATRAVVPIMREQGHGHIINISSVSGKVPLPGGSAYAATKYAVTGFSQSLLQEVRDSGIKVTTLYPGSVASRSRRHDPNEDDAWKVQPEEVGAVCATVLCAAPGTVISEVEIRPLVKPKS